MEVFRWIEPEIELLLFITFALCVYVGMQNVRIPAEVAKKLEVDLIVTRSQGR